MFQLHCRLGWRSQKYFQVEGIVIIINDIIATLAVGVANRGENFVLILS